mgnify:FL=1|jgi:hypothetical protein
MNYYNEIKTELINNEITKRVKDYSKNRSDLNTIIMLVNYFLKLVNSTEKE